MSDLDLDAFNVAEEAYEEASKNEEPGNLYEAILAYRQAECKPFKDAPRDGTDVEAWNGSLWETISVVDDHWHACSDGAQFCPVDNVTAYTHYRIPFNPEEG